MLAVRRGERGLGGVPPVPAASQLSTPQLTPVDTGLLARRPARVWPLPDSRPGPGAAQEGERRRGAARRSARPRVCRIPSARVSRRALQALPTNWFSKEVCGFSFFLPSLRHPPPPSGQRIISPGQVPWRRKGLLSSGGFPSGLSGPVSSRKGERNKERKTTDPFSSLCR